MVNPLTILWTGRCTVTVRDPQTNAVTKRTRFQERPTLKDEPCRVSFEKIASTDVSGAASVTQIIKLFIRKDADIPPGCKVSVTQNGVTTEYEQSGLPAVYTNHKEIILEYFKGWA